MVRLGEITVCENPRDIENEKRSLGKSNILKISRCFKRKINTNVKIRMFCLM